MTRKELEHLRTVASAIEAQDYRVAEMFAWLLIENAEAEHAAEDLYQDEWSELDQAALAQVA